MRHITPNHRNKEIIQLIDGIYREVRVKYKVMDEYYELRKEFLNRIRSVGFRYGTCGGFKLTYRHPKFPEFIVKVYRDFSGHRDDTQLSLLPSYLRKYFLYPIYKNKMVLIQPMSDDNRGNWKKSAHLTLFSLLTEIQATAAADRDILYKNVRFHKGMPVFIDFMG